jgi:rhodanese-related sulfurtransferase
MPLRPKLGALAALAALLAAPAGAWAQAARPGNRLPMEEFKRLHQENAVVVVDVRDAESYAAGHIPGALSVPLDSVAKHAPKLKELKKPIVTYCA